MKRIIAHKSACWRISSACRFPANAAYGIGNWEKLLLYECPQLFRGVQQLLPLFRVKCDRKRLSP
jgi:hypothetical protein